MSDDLSTVNSTKRNKKKSSFMKKTMSYIKEAAASDFSAGCSTKCKYCAGTNLKLGKDRRSVICTDCTNNA